MGTHIIQGETHRAEASEDNPLWEKTGLRASPESASGCPWRTSRLDPPEGLSSVVLWEDLSGWLTTSAPFIQAARVPIENTCHCLKSNAVWQWHCGVVFIWYSLYFAKSLACGFEEVLRKNRFWVFTFVWQFFFQLKLTVCLFRSSFAAVSHIDIQTTHNCIMKMTIQHSTSTHILTLTNKLEWHNSHAVYINTS